MKRFAIVLLILVAGVANAAEEVSLDAKVLKPASATKRYDKAFWGIAVGDVTGDGKSDVIVLERNAVRVGDIEDKSLNIKYSYEWKGFLHGVRLYTMNLDEDPAEEIIISAVELGRPSSFALDFKDGQFKILFEKKPWHLRVLELPLKVSETTSMKKMLVGQQWNSSEFFAGHIYELKFEDGKLKRNGHLKLPGWADIFDFAVYTALGEGSSLDIEELVGLEGYAPLKVYKRKGKRFKKVWNSGKRYGGTMNLVNATERQPLDIANETGISIDREPQVILNGGRPLIMAIQHDIPLRNIIGRDPYIRNGNVAAYQEDEALGFYKKIETQEIPGFIADFAFYEQKLILAVQPNTSAFYETKESTVLIFDLSNLP